MSGTHEHAPDDAGGAPLEVVRQGEAHHLGRAAPQRRVSLILPVKDAADDVRELLPLVLGQRARVELELIGVDSGSRDDTRSALAEFDATVLAVDPAEFDHGIVRNRAAAHAGGDVLVFVTSRARPANDDWLGALLAALDADPGVAGACSRVLPPPDADPLTRRDGALETSGSAVRAVKRIDDWGAYRLMSVEARRLLLNFHNVSAAIRADVFRRIPFRAVRAIGEDMLWAREALEAGWALVHEPASLVHHAHDYSLREWFMRNVDDGIAGRDVAGRELSEADADALVRQMVADDWRHLRDELGLAGEELEHWQIHAAMRRAAQMAGQWLGVNHERFPPEAVDAFSRLAGTRDSRV